MPSLLIDIGANIARLQQDVAQAQKSIQGFAKSTESAFKSLGTIAAMGGLTLGMGQAVTAFMDAERASMKMAVAMKNQGDYTKAAMADMQEYAAMIQRTTASEDDAVLSVMANLKTYGMMNDEVKRSTQAVLDLTAAKQAEGMTIERASELIGKAYMGETTALKRVGIVIDENIPKTEAYAKVMEQIQGRFGGAAAAELETYAGQWKQIKNQFGDVAEVLGLTLLKSIEAVAVGSNLMAVGFYTALEGMAKAAASLETNVKKPIDDFLKGMGEGIDKLVDKMGMLDFVKKVREATIPEDQKKGTATPSWQEDAIKLYKQLKEEALKNADASMKMFRAFDNVGDATGKMKNGVRTVGVAFNDLEEDGKKLKDGLDKLKDVLGKQAADWAVERVKTEKEVDKEIRRLTMSTAQFEIGEIELLTEEYRKKGVSQIKLAEWVEAEKKSIMIRANNETIALWEELYKQTQNDKYAQAAIDAMKEILDAEENKWRVILDSDDDAHTLRLAREQAYVDKVKGMITQIAVAEQQAVAAATRSVYDSSYMGSSFSPGVSSDFSPGVGSDFSPGVSSGGLNLNAGLDLSGKSTATQFVAYNTQINNYAQQINDAAQKAAQIAQQIADENKRIAEEYQREYDARKKTFETARGQFTDFMQERERQGWGAVQYQQQFSKLAQDFGSSQYFETSIDLLGQMIDVIKELDSIAQDQLEQQKQQTKSLQENSLSISDWLIELSQGSMAPVQSSALWATRFEELKSQAMNDQAKVGEFLTYAQKYLAFEKSYGTKGSYTAAYQSTVSAVSGLGDYMDLAAQLSNLGLGDSLSDIKGVIDAFAALGVGSVALKDAADEAALAIASAVTNTGSFATAAGAAAWQAESAAANTDTFTTSANAASLATMAAGLKTDGFTLATNSAASAAYDAAVKTGDYAAATNILKAAADLAAGSTLTAAAGTGTLGSAIDTLKNVAGTAAGAEGMGKIITSLETTLPQSAGIAGLEASGLADALQNTKTPFDNVKDAMAKTVSNLDVVGQFWADLAEQLGFSMNPANVGTALSSIQSSAYAAMPWVVSQGYWYDPEDPRRKSPTYIQYGVWMPPGSYPTRPPGMAGGGLTSGLTMAGESGSEWVVPTYEPQRSSFLRDVGADPDAIGAAIAKQLSGMGGGEITVIVPVVMDGEKIASVVAKRVRTNRDLRESMKKGIMN